MSSSFNPLSSVQIQKTSISSSTASIIPENINTTRNIPIGQTTYDILTIPDKCLRCKSAQPTIFCKDCYPFIYFCENCDDHVHSLSSKSSHIRSHISSLNINHNISGNINNLNSHSEIINNSNYTGKNNNNCSTNNENMRKSTNYIN